jgi:hypothetical protein
VALIAEAYAARGNVAVSELVHLEPGLYSRGSGELFPIIVPALTDVTVTATFPPDLRFPVIRVRVLDESAVLERVDGALIWVDATTRVSQVSFSGMLMTRDGYERRGATRGSRLTLRPCSRSRSWSLTSTPDGTCPPRTICASPIRRSERASPMLPRTPCGGGPTWVSACPSAGVEVDAVEHGRTSKRQAAVLSLLTSVEIDGFDIAGGRAPASAYQRRNAVYVPGRLGEKAQIPALLSLLSEADRSLRLSAMVALTALDLDTGAQETLRRFAESKDTEATEAAYAQEALSTIRRRARTAPSA